MPQNIYILNGTIYDEKQNLISGAVVKISEIDPVKKTSRFFGYTVTDVNGYYLLSLEAFDDKFYELAIFPPLNS
ncbi:pollen Ole e 1 allergen/extensin family protein [Romboutsia lituseburensis]|uniref:pollen Ole e 1 allergen/extensin family protein n=1 Tax=Romboutsia lituseburensis TaxID=1537 RepID=UPI00215A1085|nr:pollen Ole e 1 allergen/extensin family protein [Romboutsia lituseburensis]MCR8744764.1 pollen Ole e 1 allergen/extensin family protein [Romboutsia lituseburensis]